MRQKLTSYSSILIIVAVVAFVGGAVYIFATTMVQIFGPLLAALVAAGWIMGCRIADHVAPRGDGQSWFWSGFGDG